MMRAGSCRRADEVSRSLKNAGCRKRPASRDVGASMTIQPWNIVFFAGFVAYTWIRGHYIKCTRPVEKVLSRKDALERALFGIVLVGNLLLPVVYLFTPLLGFADYRLPAPVPLCGLAVMLAAVWLFWRITCRPGTELVRGGGNEQGR